MFDPIKALTCREWIRFYRDRTRVLGALLSPIIIWLVLGTGFSKSFFDETSNVGNYSQYFFPGMLAMILLFTTIFSMITLIEDRNEGFLQAIEVSPVSRVNILLGKVIGSTTLSLIQVLLLILFAPLIGVSMAVIKFLFLFVCLFLVSFSMSTLGFFMAYRSKSIQGFHVLMNLILMPMWMMSSAVFPIHAQTAFWLKLIVYLNPMYYFVSLIRNALNYDDVWLGFQASSSFLMVSVVWLVLFMIMSLQSLKTTR